MTGLSSDPRTSESVIRLCRTAMFMDPIRDDPRFQDMTDKAEQRLAAIGA